MTLVIAAPGEDYIVVGTDSRGTIQDAAGNRIEINIMEKLIHVTKHVCILMYGSAEVGNQLVEKFKLTLNKNIDGVSNVAEKFSYYCREELKKLNDVPIESIPRLGFLVAGLNKKGRKYIEPCIYNLHSRNGFLLGLCKHFGIQGKPIIALYKFAKYYKNEMNIQEMCRLVASSIYDTTRIDGDVGGEIKIGIISESGIRLAPNSDISKFVQEWEIRELKELINQ